VVVVVVVTMSSVIEISSVVLFFNDPWSIVCTTTSHNMTIQSIIGIIIVMIRRH
jgi:hypothetical protein